jgi:hypothetical protein
LSHLGADVNPPDLVPIAEAESEFGFSKRTLERLISDHGIVKYRRPGDRRIFVSRSDVLPHIGFREVRARYDA